MPHIAILLSTVAPENGNLRLQYSTWADGVVGDELVSTIAVNWDDNTAQTHAKLEADAKAQWGARGVTVGGADKVQIYAGRSQ